ncbi:hypothetical protein IJG72_03070 [bacterium]|nr:hypothetical protein [bacterium]
MRSLYDVSDWSDIREYQKLGEILLASGVINLEQLGAALDIQKTNNLSIGEILIKIKFIDENILQSALELQKEIEELVNYTNHDIDLQ